MKNPVVLWTQDVNYVYLNIQIVDCVDPKFELGSDSIVFCGSNNTATYNFNLQLFHNVENWTTNKTDREIRLAAAKVDKSFKCWPRICKGSQPSWVKRDFSSMEDEDEAASQDEGPNMEGLGEERRETRYIMTDIEQQFESAEMLSGYETSKCLQNYWPLVFSEWILKPGNLIFLRATLNYDLGGTVSSAPFNDLGNIPNLHNECIKTKASEFPGAVVFGPFFTPSLWFISWDFLTDNRTAEFVKDFNHDYLSDNLVLQEFVSSHSLAKNWFIGVDTQTALWNGIKGKKCYLIKSDDSSDEEVKMALCGISNLCKDVQFFYKQINNCIAEFKKKYRHTDAVAQFTPEYPTQFLAVLDSDETICAFIFFNFCSNWIKAKQTLAHLLDVEAENYLYINYIYVKEDYRRKRIDLMLVNYALNFKLGSSSVFAELDVSTDTDAIHYWKKYGWNENQKVKKDGLVRLYRSFDKRDLTPITWSVEQALGMVCDECKTTIGLTKCRVCSSFRSAKEECKKKHSLKCKIDKSMSIENPFDSDLVDPLMKRLRGISFHDLSK